MIQGYLKKRGFVDIDVSNVTVDETLSFVFVAVVVFFFVFFFTSSA